MTREEEIRAAIDKVFPCTDEGRCYEQAIGASGFELGVKWADEHPVDVWHDYSEEPKWNEPMLGEDSEGFSIYKWVGQEDCWYTFVDIYDLDRWAYIKDLLPKGGEG